ncbi:PAS domain S-box protein [Terrilactibacillus sp. S3-3]|nr:PAS domain S-box protein [Terrilactibacillus sp. S3-3]
MEMTDHPFYIVNDKSGALEGVIAGKQLLALAVDQYKALKKLNKEVDWFNLCFDTAYEGLAVVDDKGIIRMFNETYCRYVGVTKEEAIGRPVEKVIEDTRLPVVLKTGVPERNQAHRLQGQDLICHRMPLWKNGQVVGAAGMLIYEAF